MSRWSSVTGRFNTAASTVAHILDTSKQGQQQRPNFLRGSNIEFSCPAARSYEPTDQQHNPTVPHNAIGVNCNDWLYCPLFHNESLTMQITFMQGLNHMVQLAESNDHVAYLQIVFKLNNCFWIATSILMK